MARLDDPPGEWPQPPRDAGQATGSFAPAPARAGGPGRPRGLALLLTAVVALLAGLAIGVFATLALRDEDDGNGGGAAAPSSATVAAAGALDPVVEAVARARPAVVRVEATTAAGAEVGSGVVLDTAGHIVTNAHVVLGATRLAVVLADGSVLEATLVGHDFPFTDLAVLQVAPGPALVPVVPGDSDALQLGETVVAIGNPLAEFDGSVSRGVVSGLDRTRTFDGFRQDDFIQTDAPVNSGNSGGALLNLAGELVGMPTAVLRESRSGTTVEGIAFALPARRVIEVAGTIIALGGPPPRPSLELDHVDLDPEAAGFFPGAAVVEGALVRRLALPGAAADAGIRAGDIITEVAGRPVDAAHPLLNALVEFAPGDLVKVVFNRNGRIIEAEVLLAQRS